MSFTIEITNVQQLKRMLVEMHEVEGVVAVRRA
jgi:(p)ppGpp synthase/HD superfamily hydrolase